MPLAGLIVPGLAIAYTRGERDWQRFTALWCGFQLAQLALFHLAERYALVLQWSNSLLGLLAMVAFVLAVFNDLRRKRDQVHWVGVIWGLLAVLLIPIVIRLAHLLYLSA